MTPQDSQRFRWRRGGTRGADVSLLGDNHKACKCKQNREGIAGSIVYIKVVIRYNATLLLFSTANVNVASRPMKFTRAVLGSAWVSLGLLEGHFHVFIVAIRTLNPHITLFLSF